MTKSPANTARVAEVMAALKERMAAKAISGNAEMNAGLAAWALEGNDDRASIKDGRGSNDNDAFSLDQGAHLLSIISREKLLNRCAPYGADNASSEVGSFAVEAGEKSHAAKATTAREEAMASLHSSIEVEEVHKGYADDHGDPDDEADAATQVMDFYEIKTDLFDNSGSGKNLTVHRAKLFIRGAPTTTAKDANVFMLDFYNRSRDIKRRLKEMEVDLDDWYLTFKAEFKRYKEMLVSFDIEPKLAILKELDREDGSSEVIGYAAGIMFKIRNQEPVVVLYYGASVYELRLDFEFKRTPGSPIFKKGIYRDAERQHLDVDLEAPKKRFKVKKASDFT